jgi:hypothetical protein
MKKAFSVLAALLLTGAATITSAQDCKEALDLKEGSEFEMKSYNDKDKLQSSSKSRVLSRKDNAGSVEIEVKAEAFDDKGKSQGINNYTLKCDNGTFLVDMKMMINPEQMKGYEGMDVSVQADYLDLPFNPSPGDQLKDGKLTITINGPIPMNNTISIVNRKVEKTETITTPAGTFECIKITYDVETKFGFKITTKVEEWYAKGIGTVQSKTYNSKGKLQGYTQLTSLRK